MCYVIRADGTKYSAPVMLLLGFGKCGTNAFQKNTSTQSHPRKGLPQGLSAARLPLEKLLYYLVFLPRRVVVSNLFRI